MQTIAKAIGTVLFCFFIYFSGLFSLLSEGTLDLLFLLRGEKETSQEIIIIGVDEQSLDDIGKWPFPRSKHAEILLHLKTAKVIIFDFLFPEQSSDDQVFSQALKESPPVILASSLTYDQTTALPAETIDYYFAVGGIETELGKTGVVRKLHKTSKSAFPPMYQAILQATSNTTPTPYEGYINFYGPEFTFFYLSYADVLKGKFEPSLFKDKYIFIGAQAIGLGDIHTTPFSNQHPTPGVEIQATILSNILMGENLNEISGKLILAICLFFLFLLFWHSRSELFIICILALVLVGFGGVSLFLFHHNFYLDTAIPFCLFLSAYLSHLIIQAIWVTQKLYTETKITSKNLQNSLASLYPNQPIVADGHNSEPKHYLTSAIRNHFDRLHSCVQALESQKQLIQHLLQYDAPPFAIWRKEEEELAIMNSSFTRFWNQYNPDGDPQPTFAAFISFAETYLENKEENIDRNILDLTSNKVPKLYNIQIPDLGTIHYFQISIQVLSDNKTTFAGYLVSFNDVTEAKQLEKIKGEVLSIVSHELKLPLTTILGYGEMLADTLPREQAQYAEEICTHSRRLNKMIVDFLDIERMESGSYSIQHLPFDFLEIVNNAITAIGPVAKAKELTIKMELPSKSSPMLGDELLVLQAILNILDNAVKFSFEKGEILLQVTETPAALVTAITDHGQGIAQSQLDTIFSKFVRGDVQNNQQGFGLGLSFVKQIIDAHQGSISVQSTPGCTTFTLVLPKISTPSSKQYL